MQRRYQRHPILSAIDAVQCLHQHIASLRRHFSHYCLLCVAMAVLAALTTATATTVSTLAPSDVAAAENHYALLRDHHDSPRPDHHHHTFLCSKLRVHAQTFCPVLPSNKFRPQHQAAVTGRDDGCKARCILKPFIKDTWFYC
jgi:hypothetical protein